MKSDKVVELDPAWVAWVNTDGTEGRGWNIPMYVCECKETAVRLGRGKNVQGSDANIRGHGMYSIGGVLYGPVRLIRPTEQDLDRQKEKDKMEAVLAKAKKLGLDDDEVEYLRGGPA